MQTVIFMRHVVVVMFAIIFEGIAPPVTGPKLEVTLSFY